MSVSGTIIRTRTTNIEAPPGFGWYCADWGIGTETCRLMSDEQIAWYRLWLPGIVINGPYPDFNTCSSACSSDPFLSHSWYCLTWGLSSGYSHWCWYLNINDYNYMINTAKWLYDAGPFVNQDECSAGCQPPVNTTIGEKRKWFHATMKVLDTNRAIRAIMTSLDEANIGTNANDRVRARENTLCASVVIPVPAWNPTYAAGQFYFRASQADLASGPAWVVPTDYDSIVSLQNRFTFEYIIIAALDSTDTSCSSIGPPDVLDPRSPYSDVEDAVCNPISNSCQNISFLFPQIPYIGSLGCCSISISNPGPILPPGPGNDGNPNASQNTGSSIESLVNDPGGGVANTQAARGWFISGSPTDTVPGPILYSYDTSTAELINRGSIEPSGIGTIEFFGLTWDNRNFLWALERQGIRQILPGLNPDNPAIAIGYADIQDRTGEGLVKRMFPVDITTTSAAMKFNASNNMLYIFSNAVLYELSKNQTGGWTIERHVEYSADTNFVDIAFDPSGTCYCLYNGDLATVGVEDNFGEISNITSDARFEAYEGLDFTINTVDSSNETRLYSITDTSSPQTYFARIDKSNGDILSTESVTINAASGTTYGLAGTIAGEDRSVHSLPFLVGRSPWLFLIEGSSAMNGYNRWETVISGMEAFLDTEVFFGDKMFIVIYGGDREVIASEGFRFETTDDIDRIRTWLTSQSPSGSSLDKFCNNELTRDFLSTYSEVKNIIVIGSSGFSEYCSGNKSQEFSSYVQSLLSSLIESGGDMALVFRGIGIYPESNGRRDLQTLGSSGGGGYTEWVTHG